MHRRPLGRGRQLAALAAAVIVIACLLPWWGFGGGDGLAQVAAFAPPFGGLGHRVMSRLFSA